MSIPFGLPSEHTRWLSKFAALGTVQRYASLGRQRTRRAQAAEPPAPEDSAAYAAVIVDEAQDMAGAAAFEQAGWQVYSTGENGDLAARVADGLAA